jgi:hypothetical protein
MQHPVASTATEPAWQQTIGRVPGSPSRSSILLGADAHSAGDQGLVDMTVGVHVLGQLDS